MTTWPFTPSGQCCTDGAPLACARGGFTDRSRALVSSRVDSAQVVDSPEFRRRLHESVNSAGCQSIPYFLSDRSYLTRTVQPLSILFSVNFFRGLMKVSGDGVWRFYKHALLYANFPNCGVLAVFVCGGNKTGSGELLN